MKVALVHELLTIRGGAERVFRILTEMFPEAPIYTLLYDEARLGAWFPRERVRTSHLQRYIGLSSNHHLYLPFFPAAVEEWDFSEFDLVISSSSAFAHGIITNSAPRHLCYVQSPARYLWDRTHDVLERAGSGLLGPLRRRYLEYVFHKLRIWDVEASDRPDMLIAASKEVQRRIELYWRRPSQVIHPPIDDFWLQSRVTSNQLPVTKSFLVVSTLVPYKRVDLAMEACNRLSIPLAIAGEGPDRSRLERMAGPTVTFRGFVPNEELRNLMASATALILPGDEDFGLVTLEAMACGTPVIAYRSGGALETIIEGKTGAFFREPTVEGLMETLSSFDRSRFDPEACRAHASQFSRERFEKQIHKAIETL